MGVDAVVEDPNVKSAFFTLMPAKASDELKADLFQKLLDKFFHQARSGSRTFVSRRRPVLYISSMT